jgi:hypothetical protein
MRGTSGAISGILKLPLLEHAESATHIEAIVNNFFTASPLIKKPNVKAGLFVYRGIKPR